MGNVRRHNIELTGEGGQSKRNRKNSNQKDAFETNNEADGRKTIILNKEKYFYEKCNRVIKNVIGDRHANVNRKDAFETNKEADGRKTIILDKEKYFYKKYNRVSKNVIGDRHANVNRAQPVKGKRLFHEDYQRNSLDQIRNKRLKEIPAKHEKSGPVNRNRFNHVTEFTVKKEVTEEGQQKGKCNELHEKNISVKVEEKNFDDDTSTEVEVLDSDEIIKRRTSTTFVPSTIYRSDCGVSKASSGYREKVLDVLKKPFDKTEYRRLSEEVKLYLANYPDLKMKLNQHRYKRLTRMTILRGFFYWLQNVMHDGAFQPWEDSQCLAVQPGSGQGN